MLKVEDSSFFCGSGLHHFEFFCASGFHQQYALLKFGPLAPRSSRISSDSVSIFSVLRIGTQTLEKQQFLNPKPGELALDP